jgi:hypothetical protein
MRVIGFEPLPQEHNSQDNINLPQNHPTSSQTKELKNSLITGSRFNMMVKENVKKNSEVNSTNATIAKSTMMEKRALTSRFINQKNQKKHTNSNPHNNPEMLALGTTRKSMNLIHEQSKGRQVKKNSRFNSIGHAGQIQTNTNVYSSNLGGLTSSNVPTAKKQENYKKPSRTERHQTQISFKDMMQPKQNSVSSTRISGVFGNHKN